MKKSEKIIRSKACEKEILELTQRHIASYPTYVHIQSEAALPSTTKLLISQKSKVKSKSTKPHQAKN